jgi:hypothetical protein
VLAGFVRGNNRLVKIYAVTLNGLVVNVLAIVPKVRGFKPGRGRWIFNGDKIRRTTSSEGK